MGLLNCRRPKRCKGGQRALTYDGLSCGAVKYQCKGKDDGMTIQGGAVSEKLFRMVQCQENYTGLCSVRRIIQGGAVSREFYRVQCQ